MKMYFKNVADKIIDYVERKTYALEDCIFSIRYSLNVGGVITKDRLVAADIDSLSHATAYHAVWCRNLREIIKVSNNLGISYQNFIDIGSGKGKACFYTSKYRQFNKIIGVEFSEPLFSIAQHNLKSFPEKNIEFLNADAQEYKLPSQINLIFMFNPFDAVILNKFIMNNIPHFQKYESVIAYANNVHHSVLIENGFKEVFNNNKRKISLYQFIEVTHIN